MASEPQITDRRVPWTRDDAKGGEKELVDNTENDICGQDG